MVRLDLKYAGYCEASRHHALRGTKKEIIKFYGAFAHIVHPKYGHILFDTGYTRRFYTFTQKYPLKLYAQITNVFIREEEEACAQLKRDGVATEDIAYIIISHFHADHIGGLKDFMNARFITTRTAYSDIKGRTGVSALRKGFIQQLLPDDFQSKCEFIDIEKGTVSDPALGKMHDLFGDNTILLCALDGHAKGQLGALLETEKGKILLVSDAAWLKPNYESLHLPHPAVRIFFHSWKDYKASLGRIHEFHKVHPGVLIVPCHCAETYHHFKNTHCQ